MNPPSAGIWCNPPPPGTDEDLSDSSPKRGTTPERAIDRIDPFLKSSEYIKYEKKLEHRRRSRSRSRHRRRRSRSRSRGRHKHRRRHYSSSRSRSRSRRRHKRAHSSKSRSRRSKSRSRHSKSRSKSRSRSRSHRSRPHRSRSRRRSPKNEPETDDKIKVEDEVEEEEEEEDVSNENVFKNDGSFLEMFKKMQEEQLKQKSEAQSSSSTNEPKAPPLPAFGKRRGGKVLKTGMVQKNKTMSQEESNAQDAWTLYMKEVKRYKEACCDDDSKTRLLVK